MSKIAKRIILLPPSVKINLDKEKKEIFFIGPLGRSETLSIPSELEIISKENKIITNSGSKNFALAGTYNSLISNMIKGVTEGHEDILEVKGVGYKVSSEDNNLVFSLGKSHLDHVKIPPNLEVKLEVNKIIIKGINKQLVKMFAANSIRNSLGRMPSVYKKSKGIYYLNEEKNIKLKVRKSLKK